MVFPRKLEVKQCHTDEGCHDNKEGEGKEENAKESVDLVSPHRSKDVMEFDVNSREG